MPRSFARSRDGATFRRSWRGSTRRAHAGLSVKINTVALTRHQRGRDCSDRSSGLMAAAMDFTLDRNHAAWRYRRGSRRALSAAFACSRPACTTATRSTESNHRTGGPARYFHVAETGGRVGFITPLTHNFCESCNRVRVTCTGTMYMCLGQNDSTDLRAPLRASPDDDVARCGDRRSDRPQAEGP